MSRWETENAADGEPCDRRSAAPEEAQSQHVNSRASRIRHFESSLFGDHMSYTTRTSPPSRRQTHLASRQRVSDNRVVSASSIDTDGLNPPASGLRTSLDLPSEQESASSFLSLAEAEGEMTSTTSDRYAEDVVDLTASPSHPTDYARPRIYDTKRRASESGGAGRSKRKRVSREAVDLVDLVGTAPSVEEELRQTQQLEKIGKMNCIICMEPYTNATVSHCGMSCMKHSFFRPTLTVK